MLRHSQSVGKIITISLLFFLSNISCSTLSENSGSKTAVDFYNVGHRGTRGLMPENSIPAMIKGLQVGANTIEFDLHVTRDGKPVLSHDATINPEHTLMPDGSELAPGSRQNYAFYNMDYEQVRRFITGKKFHPAFPSQHLQAAYIPFLSEVIDSVEAYTKRNNLPPAIYMPEIKSNPNRYGIDHPHADKYVEQVMADMEPWLEQIEKRLIIQCYDKEVLRLIHKKYPRIQLALLSKTKATSIAPDIKDLGFTPSFYLPEFRLVNAELIKDCRLNKVRVIPWTSNEPNDMARLISMGVDGVITDYPDRLYELRPK